MINKKRRYNNILEMQKPCIKRKETINLTHCFETLVHLRAIHIIQSMPRINCIATLMKRNSSCLIFPMKYTCTFLFLSLLFICRKTEKENITLDSTPMICSYLFNAHDSHSNCFHLKGNNKQEKFTDLFNI